VVRGSCGRSGLAGRITNKSAGSIGPDSPDRATHLLVRGMHLDRRERVRPL